LKEVQSVKLIEAINTVKTMERNAGDLANEIRKLAARPSFRSGNGEEKQRLSHAMVEYSDIVRRIAQTKRAIDYTNMMATADVNGTKYTLHDLILHKHRFCPMMRGLVEALDDGKAMAEVADHQRRNPNLKAEVIRNFDPDDKRKRLRETNELESKMDSALQIANASVDLMMPPTV
jgi:hypothetical protein